MSALDIKALAELQRDVDGWPGEFRYADRHSDDDGDLRFGALLYDNGEDVFIIGDTLDDHVGESLARMLNATGPLLAMLKLGGGR